MPIPLKPEDGEVPLQLQDVLNTAYDRAAYDLEIDYHRPPQAPLLDEYQAWVDRQLHNNGLR